MNGLLCRAMYEMGQYREHLSGWAHIAAQDNDLEWERALCDAIHDLDGVAAKLIEARGEGDEVLALDDLLELAGRLAARSGAYAGLLRIYESLALVARTS